MSNKSKLFRGSPQYYERIRSISLGNNILDFLSLNMPPVCNYRCQFCLSGMNGKQIPTNSLTRDELQNVILEAKELGVLHIEVSGEGEPLVYRRMLEDIISFSSSIGIHTTLFTNGSLITEDFLQYLNSNDTSLAISFNYLGRKRYENFAGNNNSYEDVIRNIELARNIFRNKTIEENGYRILPLAIHTILTTDNINNISQIRELAGDDIFLSIESLMNRGNAQENPALSIEKNDIDSIISRYSDGSLIVSDTALRNTGNLLCGTFYYGVGIRYDGEVLFDAHAYDTAGLFGNVKSFSLQNLINQVKNAQNVYFEKFADEGFCPLRNLNFDNFVYYLKKECG